MLVGVPIGLWVFAMVADLVHLFGWGSAVWKVVALYAVGGGIVAALVAAVPGFIDFTSISDRRVRKVALTHMMVNLVVVGLFALSFWLRLISPLGGLPVAVAGVGIVLLGLGGWLGGELVFVHGMGVEAAGAKPPGRAAGRRIA
ncbi:MAG: DUF2231 domain-containing protein [Candidatus Rokuibacteriota bacterium]